MARLYKSKKTKVGETAVTLTQLEEKNIMAPTNTALEKELFTILLNIQDKLSSPVFNGGFERLVSVVEDIKTSQQKTELHITELDKRIYEPDEGLFSRIKAVEKQNEQGITTLRTTQAQEVENLKIRVNSLEKFEANVHKALWYVIPAYGVGLAKIVWDLISSHITLK